MVTGNNTNNLPEFKEMVRSVYGLATDDKKLEVKRITYGPLCGKENVGFFISCSCIAPLHNKLPPNLKFGTNSIYTSTNTTITCYAASDLNILDQFVNKVIDDYLPSYNKGHSTDKIVKDDKMVKDMCASLKVSNVKATKLNKSTGCCHIL